MIHLRQRIVPRSRTHTGALWEAATEFDGNAYSAASRHGAPQALARVLVAAGVPDQPVEVHSEVCLFDDGRTIRTEELKGGIRCSSLHAMAGRTFNEGDRPLHRTRYTAPPEGVSWSIPKRPRLSGVVGKNAFHRRLTCPWKGFGRVGDWPTA